MNSVFQPKRAVGLLALSVAAALTLPTLAQAQTPQQIAQSQARWEAQWQAAQLFAAIHNWPLEMTLPTGQRGRLVRVEGGKPVYYFSRDRVAAITVSADRVWPGAPSGLDLTGAGVLAGVWDIGTMSQHPEFAGRLQIIDQSGPDDHANQCGGAIGATGVNPNARGMAYQVQLRSWDSGNDRTEVLQAAAGLNMRVSNHSYGPQTGWVFGLRGPRWGWLGDPAISQTTDWQHGAYLEDARTWDETQFNAPSNLIVIAAGNQRLDGPTSQPVEHDVFENGNWTTNTTQVRDLNGGPIGYDSLPFDSTAKNPLIVGAVEKNSAGYTGPSGVRMSSFSVWGPTDDGRIKPDLVAPGVNLFMPVTNTGYSAASGTSFAAPVAAGVIALFQQAYLRGFGTPARAATMKALAIHTADEAGDNPGPDYVFGWGQINALTGANLIQTAIFNPEYIQQRRLQSGQTSNQTIRVGSGGELRVTLAWMDPAGTQQTASLNPRDPRLVNDLDLRVINQTTGEVFLPWRLDPANPAAAATRGDNRVDNVEQIVIPNPTAGNYTIRVTHKGGSLRPGGGQDYSVIISAPVGGGLQSMNINPTSVVGGAQSSFATVFLEETRNEPTVLSLSSSNSTAVQIPSTVTIPANESSASFTITTRPVQTAQTVRIFAGGSVGTVNAELEVRPVALGGNLVLSQGSIVGGNTLTGTVTLLSPAPAGGATVFLGSSRPSVARSTRNWIRIPAGQTTASFSIATNPVLDPTGVDITATRGATELRATVQVVRSTIESFIVSANNFRGGISVTGTVRLDGPAPAGGAVIQLASSNTAVATVPATVTIPRGARQANFTIRTFRPSVTTPVTITTTRFGQTRQRTLTITP